MAILSDNSIRAKIKDINLVNGLIDEPFGPRSPIQPCSVDLHAGTFDLPTGVAIQAPLKDPQQSNPNRPVTDEITLSPGQTIVITTKETVKIPNNIGVLVSTPTKLSSKGILVVNNGHVDPGYSGALLVIAINMGKDPVGLRIGDTVLTLVFFMLDDTASRGYESSSPVSAKQAAIGRVSADFLNVEGRAKTIADQAAAAKAEEVAKKTLEPAQAEFRNTKLLATAAAGITVLLAGAGTWAPNFLGGWGDKARQLESRISAIENRADSFEIDRRLKNLEAALQTNHRPRGNKVAD